jgi:hypothetical protein
MPDQQRSFPGAVGAVAALITALVGAVPVIMAVRGNNDGSKPPSAASPSASASPSAPDSAAPSMSPETSPDETSGAASTGVVIPSPAKLDFGKVVPGLSPSTRSVEFTNTDDQPVTLGRARIIGPGAAAFAVADSSCDGKELAPEDSCTVEVRFVPAVAGVLAGTLIIDRGEGDPLKVLLSGTASLL